jgi:hypothetical protein
MIWCNCIYVKPFSCFLNVYAHMQSDWPIQEGNCHSVSKTVL